MLRSLSVLLTALLLSAAAPAFTGTTPIQQLFILKEVAPQVERVGLLWTEDSPNHEALMSSIQRAAASTGVEVFVAYVDDVSDLAGQYRALQREHDVQALWVIEEEGAMGDKLTQSFLVKESLKRGLPLLAPSQPWVDAGAALHLAQRDGEIHLVANKSAIDALGLAIPEKYTAKTSFLALH